jgi:hypothetical protein
MTVIYTTPSTRHISMQTYADDRIPFVQALANLLKNVSSVLYYVLRTSKFVLSSLTSIVWYLGNTNLIFKLYIVHMCQPNINI